MPMIAVRLTSEPRPQFGMWGRTGPVGGNVRTLDMRAWSVGRVCASKWAKGRARSSADPVSGPEGLARLAAEGRTGAPGQLSPHRPGRL